MNLVERVLEVFCEPENGSYRRRSSLELGSRVTPQAWPDLELERALSSTLAKIKPWKGMAVDRRRDLTRA